MKILDVVIMAVLSAAVTVGAALAYRQVWGVYEEKAEELLKTLRKEAEEEQHDEN